MAAASLHSLRSSALSDAPDASSFTNEAEYLALRPPGLPPFDAERAYALKTRFEQEPAPSAQSAPPLPAPAPAPVSLQPWRPPSLVVHVALCGGRTGDVHVCDGDSVNALADAFVRAHCLDADVYRAPLVASLRRAAAQAADDIAASNAAWRAAGGGASSRERQV
jgi:hypothetical protein